MILLNQFDCTKMTYTSISLSRHEFSKFSSSHEIMVEGDAAGLDYIDKVSKRAVEIIFHAEWEKSVVKSHELLVQ